MRYSPLAIALSVSLACVGSAALGQKPDDQIDPRSISFLKAGEAALAQKQYALATDNLETALAIDPRNRAAFRVLGAVARAQGFPGKAVRFYREALDMEPNDLAALEGQGEALVQRGAVEKARENLARIRKLCKADCAPAQRLSAVIAKGAPAQVVAAQTATEVPKPNTPEQN